MWSTPARQKLASQTEKKRHAETSPGYRRRSFLGYSSGCWGQSLVSFKVMPQETAIKLTRKTLVDCSKRELQLAVTMVEFSAIGQIMVRDRFAGPHSQITARRKAWTAASFRTDTSSLADATNAGVPAVGVRHVTGTLMTGGGVPVEANGSIVGGIGVSSTPSGGEDNACARVIIGAIPNYLAFCTGNHLLNKTKR